MAVKLRKSPMQIKGQVTRLRVFAAVKRVMEAEGRCPTATEVGRMVGVERSTAGLHMVALRGAAGLPLPIDHSGQRNAASEFVKTSEAFRAGQKASLSLRQLRMGHRADENNIPVDILLAGEA